MQGLKIFNSPWDKVGVCNTKTALSSVFSFLIYTNFVLWWVIMTLAAAMWVQRHSRGSVTNNQAANARWFRACVGWHRIIWLIDSWKKRKKKVKKMQLYARSLEQRRKFIVKSLELPWSSWRRLFTLNHQAVQGKNKTHQDVKLLLLFIPLWIIHLNFFDLNRFFIVFI